MDLYELLHKWKISRQQLAERMGMLKGTFHNKFTDRHSTKFSDDEIKRLKGLLKELRDDINKVLKNNK